MFRWMIVFGQRRRKANGTPELPRPAPDMVKAGIEARHRKLTIIADRLHTRQRENGKRIAARPIG